MDNGHGMKPEMLPYAIAWGGTHRFNNRRGFGRYGFGLPLCMREYGKNILFTQKQRKMINGVVLHLT